MAPLSGAIFFDLSWRLSFFKVLLYNLLWIYPYSKFMKKILYSFLTLLMLVGLTACFGARDVASFSMTFKDQSGVATLNLTPDYSKRTFAVDYKKDFSDKKQKSAAFTGQMGGEYFDRFEEMTKYVKSYKVPTDSSVVKDELSFKAMVENADKTVQSMEVSPNDAKNIGGLKAFYDDILKLLTVTAPV